MKKTWIKGLTVALVVAGVLFAAYRMKFAPSDWDAAVFDTVAAHLERTGVTSETNAMLRSLSESVPIYVAESGARDATIVASNYTTAVGITVDAFRDQQASLYVSRGPIRTSSGATYVIYVGK